MAKDRGTEIQPADSQSILIYLFYPTAFDQTSGFGLLIEKVLFGGLSPPSLIKNHGIWQIDDGSQKGMAELTLIFYTM